MDRAQHDRLLCQAVGMLVGSCPRLVASCYWAGTSVISIEELAHRQSFDLDLHTRRALQDTRPFLAELGRAFSEAFELVEAPDEFGSGFGGLLAVEGDEKVAVQVLANYEDVPDSDLVPSRCAPGIRRVTLARYLADKVQCVVERVEARDLFDVQAVLRRRPALRPAAEAAVAAQDALLLVERLLGWSDAAIAADLRAYPEVDFRLAVEARDLLLGWVRRRERGREGSA